jgi:hypothetical protein
MTAFGNMSSKFQLAKKLSLASLRINNFAAMFTGPNFRMISYQLLLLLAFFAIAGCDGLIEKEHVVYINEFSASNSNGVTDPLTKKTVDWIEIYNSTDYFFDISNCYLTDNLKDTTKWAFPEGSIIDPYGYLIVYADGQDTGYHTNFKLGRSGEEIALFSRNKELLDYVEFEQQEVNVSMGREYDGSDSWVFFEHPTPALSNKRFKGFEAPVHSVEPEFSVNAGHFIEPFELSISSRQEEVEIRYTLNGDIPTKKSKKYKHPLKIDKTTVVRAIAIEKGKLPSNVMTNTYFVNVDKDMLIVSLTADSKALWDKKSGIYENSLRNIKRMGHIEVFDEQEQVINQTVSINISGNVARHHGQKAILVEANSKYGKETLDYRFFPNKRIYNFKSILLRAGGHPDKYNSTFIDGFGQYLTEEHLDIDHVAYRPAVLYLNGEYWGIYNIREKLTANYIVDNYSLDKSKFDLLQTAWGQIKHGDGMQYARDLKFIKECDKTDPANYEHIKTLIDVDNYIDYNICELYAANLDWPSWNIKYWRERKDNARWRWILIDLDYGFGFGAQVDSNMIAHATSPVQTRSTNPPVATALLRNLLEFPEFKQEFIQRFAASLNIIYSSERVLKILDQFKEEKIHEMPHHIDRWSDYVYNSEWAKFRIVQSVSEWEKDIKVIEDFARKRPDFIRENLLESFDLDGMVRVRTTSSNGIVTVNTIQLKEGSFEGDYFTNIPLRLEAIPKPGQVFSHWVVDGKNNLNSSLTLIPESDIEAIAVFVRADQTELPSTIDHDMTVTKAGSPWYAKGDVTVERGAHLTIEKGTTILMEKHHSIVVSGGLTVLGTEEEPVVIKPNPSTHTLEWGALCLDSTSADVVLNHLKITGGTWFDDQSRFKATITSMHSNATLNNVSIESSYFPFYSEYGEISISNSKMRSPRTCDLINIKYASRALTENCDLAGNDYPDTDAIDYDGISDGIIRNNTIYGFFGLNSDGIDVGEESSNVVIEGNRFYNLSDKGVSVGQGSYAQIRNNFFYGCNMGVGIKDSNSFSFIERNTFYANRYGVAVFEKNLFAGGGGAEIRNCIFYQSMKKPILVDDKSWVSVLHSIADNRELDGRRNMLADPEFIDITNLNLELKSTSPVRNKDVEDSLIMGAVIDIPRKSPPKIVMTEISITPVWKSGTLYWIELYNTSDKDIDFTGWTIKNEGHVYFPMPQECIIRKNDFIVLTNSKSRFLWHYPGIDNVYEVFTDDLFTRGNSLLLYDNKMNLSTSLAYQSWLKWPEDLAEKGASLKLISNPDKFPVEEQWHSKGYVKGAPGFPPTR